MHVDRLRLVGFKSFVDATELLIEPGLTGIVGPNGCGKSNLVEALRWVMGESSARRLRGGEMDDVIFNGTTGRPARNLAEVTLTIDNGARDAAFAFNDREVIEVGRRIERGAGSSYRINGREARARDVQLLFADAATGANSAAMVSQGRIGALIAAKPAERRVLLDEAAGTAGLYARRRESELKLTAAEDNLLRLDDVIATMALQLDGLRKQTRQAQRYRRLAEQIRRVEAVLLQARWQAAAGEAASAAAELAAAERAHAAAVERHTAGERVCAEAEAALPPLRLAEAAAAAALQRLVHARGALDQELQRVTAARAEGGHRLAQSDGDVAREDGLLADADAALARLDGEQRRLAADDRTAGPEQAALREELHAAQATLATAEAALRAATEAHAAETARRAALDRQRRDLAERAARLRDRLAQSRRDLDAAIAALVPTAATDAATASIAAAEGDAEARRAAVAAATRAAALRREAETALLDRVGDIERCVTRARTEAEALRAVLASTAAQATAATAAPLLTALTVTPGFEAAVAALFDDALTAPVLADADAAASGWRLLPPLADPPPLPDGAQPIAGIVTAPPVLDRALARAGWVADAATGQRLQPHLAPGQALVDRDGRLWRWDGYGRAAGAATGTAQHFRHRNRLAAIEAELAEATPALRSAEAELVAARRARQRAIDDERAAALALRTAETELARARSAEAELARGALASEARRVALAEAIDKLAADEADAAAQSETASASFAALPDAAAAVTQRDAADAAARAARGREAAARAAIDRHNRDSEARRRLQASIIADTASWRQRRDGAAAQRATLIERRRTLAAELAALDARPDEIARESEALAAAHDTAVERRRQTGDALAQGETQLRQAGAAARAAAAAVAEAQEHRIRLELRRDAAQEALARLRGEIAEHLATAPETLAAPEPDAPDPAAAAARLDRLLREREAIGPVNLIAEAEAAEVETRVAGLQRERDELTEAIARLRRGIAVLDNEGRKRLAAAFAQLNVHFATLFARLFGGGEAQLTLTDDGDPLAAGLDIIASPPGKKRQMLSLLSGGEQALAALALMLAVFMTNPAPLCVLDEVDAPLDDANVDRLCSLTAETADRTGTRFLMVTHHRVTMARMDRLYGVTMHERGLSQLVSVDLTQANRLRRTA